MSRIAVVQGFLDAIRSNPTKLPDLLHDLTKEMGFDFVTVLRFVDLGGGASRPPISTYPDEWSHYYRRNRLWATDPAIKAARYAFGAFTWKEVPQMVGISAGSYDAFLEHPKRFGIGGGIVVPNHDPTRLSGFVPFSVRDGRDVPEKNLLMAQLVGRVAFDTAQHPPLPLGVLTPRQLDCIVLFAEGLTEQEIAKRLGISAETVKRHLKDARTAFGASKTVEVVVKALTSGQLLLSDLSKVPL